MDPDETDEVAAETRPAVYVYAEPLIGGVRVKYDLIGDIDPLSVPILLELAADVARQSLGLRPHG